MARFGYVQVIRRCNQHCIFCSNPDNDEVLPLAGACALVDGFAARGFGGVLLTGGEPTLHPELPAMVAHATELGLPVRLITNGQRTADAAYLDALVAAGLQHVHLSVQSHRPEVQANLTGNDASLDGVLRSLTLLGERDITTDINTTINSFNAGHLDETAAFLAERFPWLRHWVWNNLDPTANRATANSHVLATPRSFEVSLLRAMAFLDRTGRTFRVERVPLCYMADFAHCSTETRKIVKEESREVAFLDERGHVDDAVLRKRYSKTGACLACRLTSVCAGAFAQDVLDYTDELYPVFLDPDRVRRRVLEP